tara:strand:- start:37 stop:267 length:231 start_codon:yes stop_codon:yes gene_type:complete
MTKIKTGDEKNLSEELTAKQKMKGTYDSPCLSICDYDEEFEQCQTCFMKKEEKKLWKFSGDEVKKGILEGLAKRIE